MDVSLFIPCLVDQFMPQVGMSTVRVLEHLGCDVHYIEDQTCCGQPAYNTGYREETLELAERFIHLFSGEDNIVAPSGSCVGMVKHHYDQLDLEDSFREKLKGVRERIFEFSEFLVNETGIGNLDASLDARVTYHDCCHLLRELDIKDEPRDILETIDGLELVEMENSEECCGFGGTFASKFPELSSSMTAKKVKNVVDTDTEFIVAGDAGCLMNIQGYADRRGIPLKTIHLATLLDKAIKE